jgi:hypothetical protein
MKTLGKFNHRFYKLMNLQSVIRTNLYKIYRETKNSILMYIFYSILYKIYKEYM